MQEQNLGSQCPKVLKHTFTDETKNYIDSDSILQNHSAAMKRQRYDRPHNAKTQNDRPLSAQTQISSSFQKLQSCRISSTGRKLSLNQTTDLYKPPIKLDSSLINNVLSSMKIQNEEFDRRMSAIYDKRPITDSYKNGINHIFRKEVINMDLLRKSLVTLASSRQEKRENRVRPWSAQPHKEKQEELKPTDQHKIFDKSKLQVKGNGYTTVNDQLEAKSNNGLDALYKTQQYIPNFLSMQQRKLRKGTYLRDYTYNFQQNQIHIQGKQIYYFSYKNNKNQSYQKGNHSFESKYSKTDNLMDETCFDDNELNPNQLKKKYSSNKQQRPQTAKQR